MFTNAPCLVPRCPGQTKRAKMSLGVKSTTAETFSRAWSANFAAQLRRARAECGYAAPGRAALFEEITA
jgi:hypothetical protein